jgi:hypothetical protein
MDRAKNLAVGSVIAPNNFSTRELARIALTLRALLPTRND